MSPAGEWICSPYDLHVCYGRKRDFEWVGYRVHLTECCDDTLPHLITQVETVPAIEQDHHALKAIQADLAAKDLLPSQHLVDAVYVSAKRILHSRDVHGIDLIGPVHNDLSRQARTPGALDVAQFHIDWERQQVICPQGQHSVAWYLGQDAKGELIVQILFAKQTCQICPLRERCTDARTTGWSMTVRAPRERHEMLQTARLRQQTEGFKTLYRARAGIEGCNGYLGHPFEKKALWAVIASLFLCQVGLSHRSRRGIVLFHKRKQRVWAADSSGKACTGCRRGLSKTSSAMTLPAGWTWSTSWLSHTWSCFRRPSGSHGAAHP